MALTPGMKRAFAWTLLAGAALVALVLFVRERRHPAEELPVVATLPAFELTERDGSRLALADLAGAPWIADFVFTRCRVACPVLTRRMQELRAQLPAGSRIRSVSFTVDADNDTPEVLRRYAEAHGIAGRDWLFATDGRDHVRALVREGFLLPVEDAPQSTAMSVLHSSRFALVDGAGRIRGLYDAYDPAALDRLLADAGALERGEARAP